MSSALIASPFPGADRFSSGSSIFSPPVFTVEEVSEQIALLDAEFAKLATLRLGNRADDVNSLVNNPVMREAEQAYTQIAKIVRGDMLSLERVAEGAEAPDAVLDRFFSLMKADGLLTKHQRGDGDALRLLLASLSVYDSRAEKNLPKVLALVEEGLAVGVDPVRKIQNMRVLSLILRFARSKAAYEQSLDDEKLASPTTRSALIAETQILGLANRVVKLYEALPPDLLNEQAIFIDRHRAFLAELEQRQPLLTR